MKLVHKGTNQVVQIGERVSDFRGKSAVLVSIAKPHSPASSGRVYVRYDDDKNQHGYFPSVFNLEFIEREDR